MSKPPAISFVIPVRDDADRLRECLRAIAANQYAGCVEVIVADNGSLDGSAFVAAGGGATVLHLPEMSVAALRNAGARVATGEVLAFVDADHRIDPTWLQAAAELFADVRTAAAGAAYSPPPNANWVQRAYDRLRTRGSGEAAWLPGGNLLVRKAAFEAVSGFDASLEACEDVDFCKRLRTAGYRLVADPRLRSIHFGDPATLRALFFGELWRGRDNLAVTLRRPRPVKSLLGLAIPIGALTLIVVTGCGLAVMPWAGVTAPLIGICGFLLLAGALAIRMTAARPSFWPRDFLNNWAVAAVYTAGRALALVTRATHRTRRAAGECAHA